MTLQEAEIIAKIVGHADGGCSSCVDNLCDMLDKAFPQFKWTMRDEGDEDDDGIFRHVVVEARS